MVLRQCIKPGVQRHLLTHPSSSFLWFPWLKSHWIWNTAQITTSSSSPVFSVTRAIGMISLRRRSLCCILLSLQHKWIELVEIQKCAPNISAKLEVAILCVRGCGQSSVVAEEGNFQGIAMGLGVQATSESATACASLDGIFVEWSIWHGEVFCVYAQESWKHSLPFKALFVFINVTIHEAIHEGGMRMNIDVKIQIDVFRWVHLHQHILGGHYSGMGPGRGFLPVTVQIKAHERAPVISKHHSIRIKHGHNFKDQVVPEDSSDRVVTHEEVNQTLAHIRGWSFSWKERRNGLNDTTVCLSTSLVNLVIAFQIVLGT